MAEKAAYVAVIFLIVVSVLAYEVSSQSPDHRCSYRKGVLINCTRTVYYPCPDTTDTDNPQTGSDPKIEDVDDKDDTSHEDTGDDDNDDTEDKDKNSDENDDSEECGETDLDDKHIRRWFAETVPNEDFCERNTTFRCMGIRTYTACCRGWKLDTETNLCSIRQSQRPTTRSPRITCLNGGTAVRGYRGWRCYCRPHYTGSRCEEDMCSLNCKNGGECEVVNNREKCVCTEDFTGGRCQRPRCNGGCSHGYCVNSQGMTYCRCYRKWTGKNCDVKDVKKPGVCPPIKVTTLGTCAVTCKADSSCPDKMKCCFNGCGHMCSNPADFTCSYKNKKYKIGQVFNPDACHVCTCLSPDPSKPYGGAKCTSVVCPPMQKCKHIAKNAGSCCGHCADKPVEEDQYRKPTFVNCPVKSLVILDVGPSANEARLPLTLKARDYQNNDLHVFVVKTVFKAGIGEDNFDTVVATTARDSHENYAYCQFHVKIRDLHAPNFTFCPPDVLMTKEGVADWEEPIAKDNVGLVRPPTSRHSPKDHFGKGEHLIVYTVQDYEGNIATCKFIVKISTFEFSRDTDREMAKGKYMYIGMGIALLVLVVFVVVLVLAVRSCRRRTRRPQSEAASQPPSYENAIYNVGTTAPPAYKEKAPIYETVPRKKDLSDDCGKAVDNPTYRM